MESVSHNSLQMIRELEDLKCQKQQLMGLLDDYQNDYQGSKTVGSERMRQLEQMQQNFHKKTNIIHMLNMEIKEQTGNVDNSQELSQDQISKKERLLLKTKEMQDTISMLRDDLKLLQNECFKEK